MIAVDRAVQLEHGAAACKLMQTVNILGDYRLQPALALQLSQQQMSTVRRCFRVDHFAAVEIKKNVR
ncbi:hypothetical protein D3C86_2188790 [compost metagenome]